MIKFPHLTPNLAIAALLAATMIPTGAHAGEQTRAEAAIAEAKGKIDAGDKVGAADQAPDLQRQAREALMSAQDLLSHHQKTQAIAAAHHASDLADQAITSANARKTQAERDRRNDLRDSAASAQQSAASAEVRANNAEQATTQANMRANSAEQATTNANMRADTAQQSSDAAQADALRQAHAPVTTSVAVTEHDAVVRTKAPVHHPRRRPARNHAHPAHQNTTTTVNTTSHP